MPQRPHGFGLVTRVHGREVRFSRASSAVATGGLWRLTPCRDPLPVSTTSLAEGVEREPVPVLRDPTLDEFPDAISGRR